MISTFTGFVVFMIIYLAINIFDPLPKEQPYCPQFDMIDEESVDDVLSGIGK